MSQSYKNAEDLMKKAIEHLKLELSKMRVGRANTSMIDQVTVEAYNSQMTLKEVAALTVPDAKTISIQPWDQTLVPTIEKAILAANLGLTPNNDGKMIRINLPPMTEENRKDQVKQIKGLGENAKVSVRGARRTLIDDLKKQKNDGDISEDDLKKSQDQAQKITDQYIVMIDELVEKKSSDIMSL